MLGYNLPPTSHTYVSEKEILIFTIPRMTQSLRIIIRILFSVLKSRLLFAIMSTLATIYDAINPIAINFKLSFFLVGTPISLDAILISIKINNGLRANNLKAF